MLKSSYEMWVLPYPAVFAVLLVMAFIGLVAATVYEMVQANAAEDWLNSSGVEWDWLDEYDGDVKTEEAHVAVQRRQAAALNVNSSSMMGWDRVFPVGLVA